MAQRKQPHKETVPATLPPQRAIELLRQQLAQIDKIDNLQYDSPEIKKWELTTTNILNGTFGMPDGEMHRNTREFAHAYGGPVSFMGNPPGRLQANHHRRTQNRKAVLESILQQLEILAPVTEVTEPTTSDGSKAAVDLPLMICSRFHLVSTQLQHRRQGRPTLTIADEYDVQDLLHALLRLHFDDVRPEEWTPSYGGGSSRMDFLLKLEEIVIEAKMARAGLGAREVTDELTIDAARYRTHPDCKTLLCLVYDPSGQIKNPRGIERDLAKLSGNGLEVICIITP